MDAQIAKGPKPSASIAPIIGMWRLLADTAKGNRPSFTDAAPPELAEPLYDAFCGAPLELGVEVAAGRFGVWMAVELVNDGPVTSSSTLESALQEVPHHERCQVSDASVA